MGRVRSPVFLAAEALSLEVTKDIGKRRWVEVAAHSSSYSRKNFVLWNLEGHVKNKRPDAPWTFRPRKPEQEEVGKYGTLETELWA